MINEIIKTEKEKYERLYDEVPEYSRFSPGMNIVNDAMSFCRRNNLNSILDVGCSSGKTTQAFYDKGFKVKGLDITLKGVDKEIKEKMADSFVEAPVEKMPFKNNEFDYVFCVDFLEHIHPDNLDQALYEIRRVCKDYARFQIALYPDGYGKKIDEKLHISLFKPHEWIEMLKKHFVILIKVSVGSALVLRCQPRCMECKNGR